MIRKNFPGQRAVSSGDACRGGDWLGFALLFFVGFASLQAGYSYCLAEQARTVLLKLVALSPSAALINLFTPQEHILVRNQLLLSPYAGLAVQKGCEGMEGFFLLFAAVAAFRTSLRQKIFGILAGFGIVMALNIARLVSLYYVMRFEKSAFGLLHGYLWPGVIVLAGGLFFLWWATQQEENA